MCAIRDNSAVVVPSCAAFVVGPTGRRFNQLHAVTNLDRHIACGRNSQKLDPSLPNKKPPSWLADGACSNAIGVVWVPATISANLFDMAVFVELAHPHNRPEPTGGKGLDFPWFERDAFHSSPPLNCFKSLAARAFFLGE